MLAKTSYSNDLKAAYFKKSNAMAAAFSFALFGDAVLALPEASKKMRGNRKGDDGGVSSHASGSPEGLRGSGGTVNASIGGVVELGTPKIAGFVSEPLREHDGDVGVLAAKARHLEESCPNGFVECENGLVVGGGGQTCAEACGDNCCNGSYACHELSGSVCKDGSCNGGFACGYSNVNYIISSCKASYSCFWAGQNEVPVSGITGSCYGNNSCKYLGGCNSYFYVPCPLDPIGPIFDCCNSDNECESFLDQSELPEGCFPTSTASTVDPNQPSATVDPNQASAGICPNGFVECVGGFAGDQTCADACAGQCCNGDDACASTTASVCKDGSCSGYNACYLLKTSGQIIDSCKNDNSCYQTGSFYGRVSDIISSCNGNGSCERMGFCEYANYQCPLVDSIANCCNSPEECFYFSAYGKPNSLPGSCFVAAETTTTTTTTTTTSTNQPPATVDPNQPSATVDPNQPSATVDPNQPSATVDPNQPSATVDPNQPSATVDPNQPSATVDPNQPSATVDPNQPSATVDPNQPSATTTTSTTTTATSGNGSGRWYVDWMTESCKRNCVEGEGCSGVVETKSDLFATASSCCELQVSWDKDDCVAKSLGLDPSTLVPYTGKFFIDEANSKCVQDCDPSEGGACGGHPADPSLLTNFNSILMCCQLGLPHVSHVDCVENSGGIGGIEPVSENLGSGQWYLDWDNFRCQKDCNSEGEDADCGGIADPAIDHDYEFFPTAEMCCNLMVSSDAAGCIARSHGDAIPAATTYSGKFYVDYVNEKCVQDCDPVEGGACGGNPTNHSDLKEYSSVQMCCSLALSWIQSAVCVAASTGSS